MEIREVEDTSLYRSNHYFRHTKHKHRIRAIMVKLQLFVAIAVILRLSDAFSFTAASIHNKPASPSSSSATMSIAGDTETKILFKDSKDVFSGSPSVSGYVRTKDPSTNKGHAFTEDERTFHRMRGLFPAGDPFTLDMKVEIAMQELRKKTSPIEKYTYLHTIQDSDETLFYAILCKHTTETMPFVYTPTVGQACLDWGKIYRHTPRGMYLSIRDKGMIRDILDNYPHKGIKVVVFTDGERILGLGDLGVNGMGIPIGKLALYTACAGIHPSECLPVHIDVGIDREELRNDPTYMGLRQARVRGQEYDELIAEFIDACQDAYGRQVLLQFEDFGNSNAFRLLDDHKEKATVFNDDIQGTASVVLAGIISSLPLVNKQKLAEHRFLFYGAGEAGVGIGNQISSYIQKELGCSLAEARTKVWFVDSKGLITNARGDKLAHHKEPYAHPPPAPLTGSDVTDSVLLDAVRRLQPTALIGVSAVGGAFDEQVVKEMASLNADPAAPPLIFALSNPTTKAECTAEQAYTWTNGHVVYASGSPFDPVDVGGKHFVPGQGNNAYIFPGVGLGAVAAGALTLTDDDFSVAAASLAAQVTPDRLAVGCAYPPLKDIREVSLRIAADVAWHIIKEARCSADIASTLTTYDDVVAKCRSMMYTPAYH